MSEENYDIAQEDKTPVCIKYRCTHLTCRLECYTGELNLTKGRFDRLAAGVTFAEAGQTMFKSPSMICKIASTQDFVVVEFTNADSPIAQGQITDEIRELEGRKTQLKRHLQHEKQAYERKVSELKQEGRDVAHRLKTLRLKQQSQKEE